MSTAKCRYLAETLVPGEAAGEILQLDEPLSFSGGLDSATGLITDKWHPQFGQTVTGKILSMPSGRGSSSGSAVLAEALRRGTGPLGIILTERDGIVATGVIVANDLYAHGTPLIAMSSGLRVALKTGTSVRVVASDDEAFVEPA